MHRFEQLDSERTHRSIVVVKISIQFLELFTLPHTESIKARQFSLATTRRQLQRYDKFVGISPTALNRAIRQLRRLGQLYLNVGEND